MADRTTYPRRRNARRVAKSTASGACVVCGEKSGWLSVQQRCWSCEMDATKKRPPMFIEKDVLRSAPSKNDEK